MRGIYALTPSRHSCHLCTHAICAFMPHATHALMILLLACRISATYMFRVPYAALQLCTLAQTQAWRRRISPSVCGCRRPVRSLPVLLHSFFAYPRVPCNRCIGCIPCALRHPTLHLRAFPAIAAPGASLCALPSNVAFPRVARISCSLPSNVACVSAYLCHLSWQIADDFAELSRDHHNLCDRFALAQAVHSVPLAVYAIHLCFLIPSAASVAPAASTASTTSICAGTISATFVCGGSIICLLPLLHLLRLQHPFNIVSATLHPHCATARPS